LTAPATVAINTSPPGARVRLEQYTDVDGRRQLSPGEDLGVTPLPERSLGPGSYRLTFERDGRAPVRYPLLLRRGEVLRVNVDLPLQAAVPPGYAYVPPGRFLFGSSDGEDVRRFLGAPPEHEVTTGGYLIGKTEVTFGEYLEFLRDLSPPIRAEHTPRVDSATRGSLALDEAPGGLYRLTVRHASTSASALEGAMLRYPARDRRIVQDWRRFPISALSWADAQAYLDWLSRTGRLPGARLCDEHEWERAARGADDRIYPHGDRIEPDDANYDATYGRRPEAFGYDEVGSHPASASPFGVEDLVGNVWEWTASIQKPGETSVRGGSFFQEEFTDRSTNRDVGDMRVRDVLIGLRVCTSFP
jgi:formylglycine-generating enzyme required for sulfatase activity